MISSATLPTLLLGIVLILSSLGVILARQPVHACLSFLLTLLSLAALYLQLSAEFIAIMQVLVYAGAILVIFMFVIVLFQDAHIQIERFESKSFKPLLLVAAVAFLLAVLLLAKNLVTSAHTNPVSQGFGTVEALGLALYVDFFFPFEAITLLFLVAGVGALYIGRKGEN